MAWESLKNAVSDVIKANGSNQITGNILQDTLLSIINIIGQDYSFVGIANTSTIPSVSDRKVFYLASSIGTYPNFGSIDINTISFLLFDGASWTKLDTGIGFRNNYPFKSFIDTKPFKNAQDSILGIQLLDGFDKSKRYGIKTIIYHADTNTGGLTLLISDLTANSDFSSIVFSHTNTSLNISTDKSFVYELVSGSYKIRIRFNFDKISNISGANLNAELSIECFGNTILLSNSEFISLLSLPTRTTTNELDISQLKIDIRNTINDIANLADYNTNGKNKTYNGGTSVSNSRIGVILPINYYPTFKIRINATQNTLSGTVSWEVVGTGTIVTKTISWVSDGAGAYYYEVILSASQYNAISNVFAQLSSSGALSSNVTISVVTLSYDELAKDAVTVLKQQVASNTANKQNKQISINTSNPISITANAGGSTLASNVFTIPIGQTGNNHYFGIKQQKFDGYVGEIIVSTHTIIITNYTQLQQPVTYSTIVQRFQGTSYISDIFTDNIVSVIDSISGSTLTKTITISRPVLQTDIDNKYYYGFLCKLSSISVVTLAVTETFISTIAISTDIEKHTGYIDNKVNNPNEKYKTINYQMFGDGVSHSHVGTAISLKTGNIVKVNLLGDSGIKYSFQCRGTDGSFPVLKTNLTSNTEYEIEITQDMNLFGFTELSSNTVAGNAYLSLEIYSYLYEEDYKSKRDISTLSANQTTVLANVNFLSSNFSYNRDSSTLITNTRKGFRILSSISIDYIDKALKGMEFYSFHSNIKKFVATLNVVSIGNYIEFKYEVTTNRDIVYTGSIFIVSVTDEKSVYWPNTPFGLLRTEIDYVYLRSNEVNKFKIELEIKSSIDTADVYNSDVVYDLGQNEWIPTINSGFLGNLSYGGTSYVDNKLGFSEAKTGVGYGSMYWSDLQPDNSTSVNSTNIYNALSDAITGGFKKGLLILPSTIKGSGGNTVVIDGNTVYYRFPTWLYSAINEQTAGVGVYKPTVQTVTDYATGNPVRVMFLDYRDVMTQNYFKNAIDLLYTYFHSDTTGISYYKYVEYLKLGLFSTWGEGSPWDNIPDATTLITVSDYVVNKFTDRICLQPIAPILGSSYPVGYKDYLSNAVSSNNITFGLFVDNIGKFQDRYREYTNFNESYYQKLYKFYEKAPIYAECWQYLPDKVFFQIEPNFRRLVTEVLNFRPNWIGASNLFYQTNTTSSSFIFTMLKKISHFAGVKIYLQNNRTVFNSVTNIVSIWFTIGNMGTSKIYFSYWKLKVTVTDGTLTETFLLSFDLKTLKPCFNIGVINWRESSAIIQDLQLTNTYNPSTFSVALEIVDSDNIVQNMYINKTNKYFLINN